MESRKAEHLDMDKRSLKDPLFSSSRRDLAKGSSKHLNFSPVPPACSELSKSPVWLSQNSSDVSAWFWRVGGSLLRAHSSDPTTS